MALSGPDILCAAVCGSKQQHILQQAVVKFGKDINRPTLLETYPLHLAVSVVEGLATVCWFVGSLFRGIFQECSSPTQEV